MKNMKVPDRTRGEVGRQKRHWRPSSDTLLAEMLADKAEDKERKEFEEAMRATVEDLDAEADEWFQRKLAKSFW